LHRILALKGLGFSLEQIAAILDEGLTAEQMRGMLRLRHAQISQELAAGRSRLREVEERLRQIEREERPPSYDVVLKRVEPQLLAAVRGILPSHGAVGALFGEVHEALGEHAYEAGQSLVLWYDAEFKERDVDGAAAFVLRRPVPERGRMRVIEMSAATVASAVHHGSYETIGDAHEAVFAWLESNGYRVVGPDREISVHYAMPIRRNDPSYVTEIQYPIETIATS
jgi:effector-binding domain-containing protein